MSSRTLRAFLQRCKELPPALGLSQWGEGFTFKIQIQYGCFLNKELPSRAASIGPIISITFYVQANPARFRGFTPAVAVSNLATPFESEITTPPSPVSTKLTWAALMGIQL